MTDLVVTPTFDGQRLRALRREQGLSADKLGRMAYLSTRHIWRLEGNKRPNVAAVTLGKLACALNTSIEYLLGLTNEPGNPFTKPECNVEP
jgi:transcriptional regulator with XRE-family HTH domain